MALSNFIGRLCGRKSDGTRVFEGEDNLVIENNSIIMKGDAPPVKTVKKRIILLAVAGLGIIFGISLLFGFMKGNKKTENVAFKNDHISESEKVSGSHLSGVPGTYQEAGKQGLKNGSGQAQLIKASAPQSQYVQQPVMNTAPPAQYSQVPMQRYGVPPSVPQVPVTKSEFTDAQKSPISFKIDNNEATSIASRK